MVSAQPQLHHPKNSRKSSSPHGLPSMQRTSPSCGAASARTRVPASRHLHFSLSRRMSLVQAKDTDRDSPAGASGWVQLPSGVKLRPEAPLPEYREHRRRSLSSHAPLGDRDDHLTFSGMDDSVSQDVSDIRIDSAEPGHTGFDPAASTEESGTIFSRASQVPLEVIKEFEHKLESDMQTAAATVFAVVGVITFQHGIWTGLDRIFANSFLGDVACAALGLTMILWIRISGIKLAKFWPAS